jgi:AraC-like DNA-binding protein
MNESGTCSTLASRFQRPPDPALAALVVEYWGMRRDLAAMGGFRVTPDCFGELICCADPLDAVGPTGPVRLPTCFVVGLLAEPLRLEAPRTIRCLAARLHPWAVGRFFEGAADSQTPGWRDASEVLGDRAADLVANIKRLDWTLATAILEAILLDQIDRWRRDGEIAVVEPFLADNRATTATIAARRGRSSRQVERRVRGLTGVAPRQLACLSRFHRTRDAIWANPERDLASLACEQGYADQPHMTREFRKYAHMTPARFARESAQQKQRGAAGDVAFVQEPGQP